ncbi:hypothetical protein QUF73_24870 [Cytobacillus sp. NJ13]|nr:hypothetical protein [Cytobacillus sp. NJ13]
MKKLIQFKEELQKFDNSLGELVKELTAKQDEKKALEQQKKDYILSNFGEHRDQNQVRAYEIKIREVDQEIESLSDQVALLNVEKKSIFKAKLEDLKKERQELADKKNNEFIEYEKEIYKRRFELMKAIEDAGAIQQQNELELREYSELFSQFGERDIKPTMSTLLTFYPDALIQGADKVPTAPTDYEMKELMKGLGKNGSRQLPHAYELFKLTGEVVLSQAEALTKLEAHKQKGAKK